jgi:Uma2 family endonuclease
MNHKVEELYDLRDDGRLYELESGCIVSEPLPGGRHGRVAATIGAALLTHARQNKLGVVFTNGTGYVLARDPDTVRGPDVSFVARERFEKTGDVTTAFPGPPDLAVDGSSGPIRS